MVGHALDSGITLFDTADIYGEQGGSETLLGKALGKRRQEIVVATKFGGKMGEGPTSTAPRGDGSCAPSREVSSGWAPTGSTSTSSTSRTLRRRRARRSRRSTTW